MEELTSSSIVGAPGRWARHSWTPCVWGRAAWSLCRPSPITWDGTRAQRALGTPCSWGSHPRDGGSAWRSAPSCASLSTRWCWSWDARSFFGRVVGEV